MEHTVSFGLTPEELDDLAWALADAFPEIEVSLSGAQDFWEAKATQLLPVINKIRDRARDEGRKDMVDRSLAFVDRAAGREITLDEAVSKADDPGS